MTLEEAIKDCEEFAKEKSDAEHEQLAEWLRELKWRRKTMKWISQELGKICDVCYFG